MKKVTSKASKKTASKNNGTVALTSVSKIKRGDAAKIVEKTGFSPSYVSRVLNGTRYNANVINAANAITKRRK